MRRQSFCGLLASAVCCLLFFAGCAGKLPKTLPLSPVETQEASQLWSAFLKNKRPTAVDADIRLSWDVLGSKGGIGGTLQAQRPALLRFAATDPLGRSLILAVSDGRTFTLVDNRIGHVYQGRTDSDYWRSYVPETVESEDLLPFLGGFLREGEALGAKPAQDEDGGGFWYVWRDARSISHHVLVERKSGEMRRHLLVDLQGAQVLDLRYADYQRDAKSGVVWPRRLQISGEAVTGDLAIQVEQMYSNAPQGAAVYRLTPPAHFTVEQVP